MEGKVMRGEKREEGASSFERKKEKKKMIRLRVLC
jgi:hypothetical protein